LCGRKNQKNVEAFTLKLNKIYNGGARNIQQYFRGRGTVIRKPKGGIRVIWNPEPVFQILSKIAQYELEGKSNIFYSNSTLKGTSISHSSPIQLTQMVLLNSFKFILPFYFFISNFRMKRRRKERRSIRSIHLHLIMLIKITSSHQIISHLHLLFLNHLHLPLLTPHLHLTFLLMLNLPLPPSLNLDR